MTESTLSNQVDGWLDKLEHNLDTFLQTSNLDSEQDVQFITHQYHCLMMIHWALQGKVVFVGAKPIGESNEQR